MRGLNSASRLAVVISLSFGVSEALAHHSFAPHFDASKPVSISGPSPSSRRGTRTVTSTSHAVDENGQTKEYVCESHGVTQLTRNGITPDLLKTGTTVRVTGSLSRHSPYMCFFDNVELPDGRVLNVNGPRGRPTARVAPQAERKDIFGTWLLAPIPNRSTSGPQPMMQLADAGRREGGGGLRSVPRRSDVPLRSRRDPPCLGRTGARRSRSSETAKTSCCITSGWTSVASFT